MNALSRRIATLIATQGPLSIAQFMTLALHDPKDGYYAMHEPIGAAGDFITAPEISQIFGELLGLWCVQAWLNQDRPRNARLVELGPGRGTLMADALRAARVVPEFLAAVDVELVEASPTLRAVQKKRLEGLGARLAWRERFAGGEHPLFVVANEFFDALPIHQYVRTERGWCERLVDVDAAGTLTFALAAQPVPFDTEAAAPEGGVVETSPASLALVEDMAHGIARHGGAALIVDYGYTSRGFGETLQAVGGHAFRGVLDDPGAVDLSAHVDFAALARAAMRAGARTYGPLPQGDFLTAMGIRARLEALAQRHPQDADALAAGVDRLVAPAQMGTLFKVLAILPPHAPPPPGF